MRLFEKIRAEGIVFLSALFFILSCSTNEEKILKLRRNYKITLLSFQKLEKGTALDILIENKGKGNIEGITCELLVMDGEKVKNKIELFVPTKDIRPFYQEQRSLILQDLELEENDGLALVEILHPTLEQIKRFKEFEGIRKPDR